ncbi:MAG: chloride channel protein [Acidobacteriota bacterium]|nr:chloride channel protein [Acidobacteriota bacterium]
MMRPRVLPMPRRPRVTDTQRVLLLSICIGVFAGLLVVSFHFAIDLVSWSTLGTPAGASRVWTVLVPSLGGGLASLLVLLFFPEATGSGLSHTKAALYISDGYVPVRTVFAKFVACAASIGTGNSLGPEDPALQMGAGVASRLGRAFALPRDQVRLIVPVGAAAGIAAAFNTPITAVLFVMEEVIGSWNASVLGSIVLSAVSSVVVSRFFLGDDPLFRVPAFELTHPSELVLYAGVGLAAGLLGTLFVRVLGILRGRLTDAPRHVRIVQPFVAGLLVGILGLVLPQILGAGYGSIDSALHNEFSWQLLIVLAFAKIAATAICFAAGTPGGMFAPTLFVGAMLGGGVGALAQLYWPLPTSPPSAYVLVGMGTFFAAVFRAPMTSVFMVFEVSASYVIILPVMLANLLAYLLARRLNPVTFFEMVASQDGLTLPSHERQRDLRVLRVEDAMRPAAPGVGGDGDPVLHPDQSLDAALHAFGNRTVLAVVSREDLTRVLGELTLDDVLRTYGIGRDSGSR